jgi:3-oxoacyl-[acyl-carrier-protein] synthase II
MILPNMAAANVSRTFGLKGYTSTIITACAAGTQAIGEAAEVVRRGAADVVLAGGCEAGISQLGLGGFNIIKALSRQNDEPERASRPFDAKRDGFIPAEGSAVLIVESLEHALDRAANILVEIAGQGVSSDAYHAVQPDEDGSGAARAIRWALEDARLDPGDIDYINAHGTSTPLNDRHETEAIKSALGEDAYRVPISSTKSMTGHLLGAGGALEAMACVKAIASGTIPPTINLDTPDPECDLDYTSNVARRQELRMVMSNSFGFGGHNSVLILGAPSSS